MLRHLFRCRSGSTAVEFALIAFPLILLTVGAMELGRVRLIQNELAYAADRAVRKILIDNAVADSALVEEVHSGFTSGDPQLLEIQLGSEVVDTVRFRTISAAYPVVPFLPGVLGENISIAVDRRVPLT